MTYNFYMGPYATALVPSLFPGGPLDMPGRLSRITMDPDICHGKPCVRGLRYPVEMLLDLLGSGMSNEEILADYPGLEADDLRAVRETPNDNN